MSTSLSKKSAVPLDKSSVISLVKKSQGITVRSDSAVEVPWHAIESAEEVVAELGSSSTAGLSPSDAARRLQDFGPNRLSEVEKPGFLRRLWAQLNNVLIFLLFAAAIVEGALESWAEFGLILAVIAINTAIGLIQEGKAEKAADAIKAMLSPQAAVLRGGEQRVIQAEELVPGDIVLLKSGDKVPADVRLVAATNFQVQEAMLTGESVPVSKHLHPAPATASLGDRRCMAYSATNVVSGQARGVVVATGDSAEIGQINKMVNTVEAVRNNLLHQLEILGRWLVVLVIIIALLAFLLALLYVRQTFEESFASAVSIAVAIVPEGLPAVVTIVLAIGTTVMARNHAIIRQLPAVETLGSLTVICSDKTGTLTKNEMTVVKVATAAAVYDVGGVGYAPVGGFSLGSLDGGGLRPSEDGLTQRAAETGGAAGPTPAPGMGTGTVMVVTGPGTGAGGGLAENDDAAAPAPPSLDEHRMAALRRLLEGTVLCNDSALSKEVDEHSGRVSYRPLGAPTEVALLTAGEKAGVPPPSDLGRLKPRIASVPFESEHKFMATVHLEEAEGAEEGAGAGAAEAEAQQGPGEEGPGEGPGSRKRRVKVIYVKGAPDRLLPLCVSQVVDDDVNRTAPLDVGFWQGRQAAMSLQGLRVLALCRAELPASLDEPSPSSGGSLSAARLLAHPPFLSLVLLVAILDPPREEAVAAIKVAHSAGITVKMITGDHALTAMAIGRMLGIAGRDGGGIVLTGPEVDRADDEALKRAVMDCNVFARASPENKLRIVRALQELHQTVAMTGDGVNDAPALKAADVGVAMGITGTDVSKEAAKMVLADDNFASIVAAVREGRRVWDNIRKILIFNLPVNLAQGTSVLYSYILGLEQPPLTALQVLLVNLLTSVTLGLALAAEPAEPSVMNRPPRRPGKRLVGKLLLWRMFFVCHVIVVQVIGMFYWGGQTGLGLEKRRAEAFNVLVGAQIAYFVTCRFIKLSTLHRRVFVGNAVAYPSVAITAGLMVFVTYTPRVNHFFHMAGMTGVQWARVVVCMAVLYLIVETEKALVDPLLMPLVRPVLALLERHTPSWLSIDGGKRALLSRLRGLRRATGGRGRRGGAPPGGGGGGGGDEDDQQVPSRKHGGRQAAHQLRRQPSGKASRRSPHDSGVGGPLTSRFAPSSTASTAADVGGNMV